MAFLTREAQVLQHDSAKGFVDQITIPVAAGSKILKGAAVAVYISGGLKGYATRATGADATIAVVGRAEHTADATGLASGQVEVLVRIGAFKVRFAAAVTPNLLLSKAYVVDDSFLCQLAPLGSAQNYGRIIKVPNPATFQSSAEDLGPNEAIVQFNLGNFDSLA